MSRHRATATATAAVPVPSRWPPQRSPRNPFWLHSRSPLPVEPDPGVSTLRTLPHRVTAPISAPPGCQDPRRWMRAYHLHIAHLRVNQTTCVCLRAWPCTVERAAARAMVDAMYRPPVPHQQPDEAVSRWR